MEYITPSDTGIEVSRIELGINFFDSVRTGGCWVTARLVWRHGQQVLEALDVSPSEIAYLEEPYQPVDVSGHS